MEDINLCPFGQVRVSKEDTNVCPFAQLPVYQEDINLCLFDQLCPAGGHKFMSI